MNASMLLLTSAWMAGADAAPAPVAAPAPYAAPAPVVGGCASCGAPACDAGCDPCAAKPGFFSKLKAKFAKSDCGCDPCAHHAHKPVFSGFTTSACDTCDPCGKPSLLDKLKAKFAKSGCHDACAPACATGGCGSAGGCALPAVPGAVTPAVPTETPKEMPKPTTPKTTQLTVPPIVVTPVGGGAPALGSPASPF